MSSWISFPYLPMPGSGDLAPLLPIRLQRDTKHLDGHGLVDSGASVNVLPFQMGVELGLDWGQEPRVIQLGGNLARHEARAILLTVQASSGLLCTLAFAWSSSNDVRLILGQTNFFLAFDVQFRRRDLVFEIRQRQ
jgi:hypothetical protein